jgi:hypothetical protein
MWSTIAPDSNKDEVAFLVSRNAAEGIALTMSGLLQRSHRNGANIIRLTNFLECPAHPLVTGHACALVWRAFENSDDWFHRTSSKLAAPHPRRAATDPIAALALISLRISIAELRISASAPAFRCHVQNDPKVLDIRPTARVLAGVGCFQGHLCRSEQAHIVTVLNKGCHDRILAAVGPQSVEEISEVVTRGLDKLQVSPFALLRTRIAG